MTKPTDASSFLPLNTPYHHVLLGLARGPLHGYAIMQAVEERTGGVATILPGTLYTTLNRMLASGLVEESAAPADEPGDERRRRYYAITPLGREVLAAETRRLSVLVELAERELKGA